MPQKYFLNLTDFDVAATEKKKKLTSSEMRKKVSAPRPPRPEHQHYEEHSLTPIQKKDRMARRKRGEEVFSDEDD
jgi:elongation factor 3